MSRRIDFFVGTLLFVIVTSLLDLGLGVFIPNQQAKFFFAIQLVLALLMLFFSITTNNFEVLHPKKN